MGWNGRLVDLKSQVGRLEQALEEFVLAFPCGLYRFSRLRSPSGLGEANEIGPFQNTGPAGPGPIE